MWNVKKILKLTVPVCWVNDCLNYQIFLFHAIYFALNVLGECLYRSFLYENFEDLNFIYP